MIPKAEVGECRGIALLEIIYKLISLIINGPGRLISSVNFDDAMHSNLPRRGTGTAITKAKLLAQLRGRIDEPLFMVFVDLLNKAYYLLERERAMRILARYGVGANIRCIINLIWQRDTMVPPQAGYFGKPFEAKRGVRVVDTMSPMIFNITVDTVICHWRHVHHPDDIKELALFFADDGILTDMTQVRVQASLDIIIQ